MPFSEIERPRLRKILAKWVEEVPIHVRHQVRNGFRIEPNAVVIFESRPSFQSPHEWRDEDIAKFRFVRAAKEWRLFCQFRDLKWRAYEALPSADTFYELFAEVRRDPTGIFWG